MKAIKVSYLGVRQVNIVTVNFGNLNHIIIWVVVLVVVWLDMSTSIFVTSSKETTIHILEIEVEANPLNHRYHDVLGVQVTDFYS